MVPINKTRGNGHKLEIRKHFTLWLNELWHRLPQEVLESLSLVVLKAAWTLPRGYLF